MMYQLQNALATADILRWPAALALAAVGLPP